MRGSRGLPGTFRGKPDLKTAPVTRATTNLAGGVGKAGGDSHTSSVPSEDNPSAYDSTLFSRNVLNVALRELSGEGRGEDDRVGEGVGERRGGFLLPSGESSKRQGGIPRERAAGSDWVEGALLAGKRPAEGRWG